MKSLIGATVIAIVSAAAPALAQAGVRDPGINQRQHNQQQRIEQGRRSGELTRGEYRRLQNEAREVRREERLFKADGHLSGGERRYLNNHLDSVSRDIYRQKHDADQRQGEAPRSVNQRQFAQRERIEQGVRSGELTPREAHRLAAEQRSIREEERLFRADGVLSRGERQELQHDLNVASRHIYNEKHDAQSR